MLQEAFTGQHAQIGGRDPAMMAAAARDAFAAVAIPMNFPKGKQSDR
jgi:hypothetical protein